MERVLKILCKTTGIGMLSAFVFTVARSVMILREAERLAAENPLSAASVRCGAGMMAFYFPIFGIIFGAIFGLVMGGLLLLLSRVFRRQRLP
ncbi:MAG: hypothetical protein ICV68_07790 [Pyrinomonadaceae bacterium]|nr:hypothetical protein [Pyrinomonadaceae bacterium]